ncbi:MAG TPA: hypothetical protein G4N94_02795 [Caldilineae bacterium]|nr:hypothetical protein [Caldilineae bacterium]
METSDWQPAELEETELEITEEAPVGVIGEPPVEFIEEVEKGLGFTDGFQFGCGFWVAALVVAIIAGLGFLILTFFLSFAGINLLG